jgi:hypothetical protein
MVKKIKNKKKEVEILKETNIFDKIQKEGIPIVLFQDPIHKTPSISLTLLIISFCLSIFALINKFTKIVDGVDIDNTLELFIICASLYFGRSFSKKINRE